MKCRFCGSSRIRNGYRPTPLSLRLIFFRTLLCDNCNAQFVAFSLRAPARGRGQRKSEMSVKKADPVDLSQLNKLKEEDAPEVAFSGIAESQRTFDRKTRTEIKPALFESGGAKSMQPEGQPKLKLPSETENASQQAEVEDLQEVSITQKTRPPCPRCRSIHTRRRHRHPIERMVLVFSNIRPFMCESCGRRFYAQKPSHGSGEEART